MEIGHLPAMILFSFLVSVVLSIIAKDTVRDRLLYGAKSFALFIGIAFGLGWLMYFIPWR